MFAIDEELFEGGQSRVRKTRTQKQMERQAHARATAVAEEEHPLEIAADELKTLQAADTTLNAMREAADGHLCSAGIGFFRRDGLLFRRWTPPGRDKQDMSVEQLVLPVQCRRTVLQVAHDIPMSGHLGKEKTAQRTGRPSTAMWQSLVVPAKSARNPPDTSSNEHPCDHYR